MNIETLRRQLADRYTSIEYVEETGSTNTDLLDRNELPDRTVLIANHQTKGRGRLGRTFSGPRGTVLLATVAYRPTADALDRLGLLPLAGGLAVTDVIPDTALKWPNDVLMSGGKVCGILTEADGLGVSASPRVVLGIGLNVSIPRDGLPVETATSLALEGSPAAELPREELTTKVLTALDERVRQWEAGDDQLIADYRMASSTIGQAVRVTMPSGVLEGVAEDISAEGQLVLVTEDSTHRTLSAGDVTHLRPWRPGQ